MSIISTSLIVRGQPSPRFHVEACSGLSGTVKWMLGPGEGGRGSREQTRRL